jgi:hypothetical protein
MLRNLLYDARYRRLAGIVIWVALLALAACQNNAANGGGGGGPGY